VKVTGMQFIEFNALNAEHMKDDLNSKITSKFIFVQHREDMLCETMKVLHVECFEF